MSNHPDTCLLDGHDGWVVCSCHKYRWQKGATGVAPCGCFYGNCDLGELPERWEDMTPVLRLEGP